MRLAWALAIAACASGPAVVDAIDEGRARVIDLETGEERSVPTASLPPGAREGDVLDDGRVDARRAAELRRRVRLARRRLTAPGRR